MQYKNAQKRNTLNSIIQQIAQNWKFMKNIIDSNFFNSYNVYMNYMN